MELSQVMGVLNSPNGLAQMMLEPAFENDAGHEFSQAELIADVVNIERMDLKRLAQAVNDNPDLDDVDISVSQMTPERSAQMLQGIAKGDDLGIIDVFDELEDQRMTILAAIIGDEATDEYTAVKRSMLFTTGDGESNDDDTDTEETTDEN